MDANSPLTEERLAEIAAELGAIPSYNLMRQDRRALDLLAEVERLRSVEAELRKDAARLDWCADDRICDGINGVDIDELTLDALNARGAEDTEEEWKAEWRIQFRAALDEGMKSESGGGTE